MTDVATGLDEFLPRGGYGALRLATLGVLAARIEPQLLRRLRLELAPDLDAGAEAELWFCRLVEFRARTGIVLSPRVLPALRQRLASNIAMLDAAWRVTSAAHVSASPALQVEEELTYWGLRGVEHAGAKDRVQQLLRQVVRTFVERGSNGLSEWANRALPRLPHGLLVLEETHMVMYAAAQRLGRTIPIGTLSPEPVPAPGSIGVGWPLKVLDSYRSPFALWKTG